MKFLILVALFVITFTAHAYVTFNKCGAYQVRGAISCKNSQSCSAIFYQGTRSEMRFGLGPYSSKFFRANGFSFEGTAKVSSITPVHIQFSPKYKSIIKSFRTPDYFKLDGEEKCE